ncbi:MAG: sugar ABC transporter ATP-binding protein, partial [Candidatus Atribacteria bacterium]|nr:sugar ABC transporter ATP-binding protein [Candidatus Atribacteria bacterium]
MSCIPLRPSSPKSKYQEIGAAVDNLLEFRNITKKYPGVIALQEINFTIQNGEVHALVGENGAGKSTLIQIITGAQQADSGIILWKGKPVVFPHPRASRNAGIAFLHQHRNLVPFFTGFENLFLGRPYPRRKTGIVDWKAIKKEAQQVAIRFNIFVNLSVPVNELTPGEQTMVEILRTLVEKTEFIVLDEPTASLSETETTVLLEVIRNLQKTGVTFLYVSHRLDEIFEIADVVTILRNGQVVATLDVPFTTKTEVIRLMAGETATVSFPSPPPCDRSQPVLSIQSLTTRTGRVKNVSFEVAQGEILGFFGLVGAGQGELLEALYGVHHLSTGDIRVEGTLMSIHHPPSALRTGLVLIPGERLTQGLILPQSVRENITLPILQTFRRFSHLPLPSRRKEKKLTNTMIKNLSIRTTGGEQTVSTLSGGNQQKVVLAKWIARGAKIFLCNEPTLGVDVGSRREIYRLLYELATQGAGIVVASSDIQEILTISHRIGIMVRGELVSLLPNENLTKAT